MTCSVEDCGRSVDSWGWCRKHYQRWKRNGDPMRITRSENGVGYVSPYGYRIVQVNGRRAPEHVFVAERALGRALPQGAVVHHADGDKLNNAPNNLIVCLDSEYHALLHVRAKALAASGDPSKRKCYICQKWDAVENLKKVSTRNSTYRHQACWNAYAREWRINKNVRR